MQNKQPCCFCLCCQKLPYRLNVHPFVDNGVICGAVIYCAFLFLSVGRKSERKNTMYTFTNQFISNENNLEYLKDNMMGPNAMRVAEELASYLNINEDMRILDLGCGSGLSTLLLAKKYGSCVLPLTFGFRTETMSVLELLGLTIRLSRFCRRD